MDRTDSLWMKRTPWVKWIYSLDFSTIPRIHINYPVLCLDILCHVEAAF